jgi:hypothetical protein
MKNIHILPTENPSSLFEIDGHLIINKEQLIQPKYYRNIYITNDEDINENDYIITKDGRLVQVSYLLSKDLEGASKVILTTDHDLFKDDVQAINDEFHDWFVKNPSCEFVKITKDKIRQDKEFNDISHWNIYEYKISIPQEEPKQDTVGKEFYESADKTITVYRQETIYEVAERLVKEHPDFKLEGYTEYQNGRFNGIIEGIEWQQEQDKKMYSEEEVKLLIDFVKDCATNWDCDNDSHKYNTPCRMCEAQKVLEQFKKK